MTPPSALVQSFLDDIVAHPDDASAWLILADWLEDQQDPRAELVRLTQQLRAEPQHRQFKKRQTRLQALLASGVEPIVPRRTLGTIDFAWIPPGSFRMGSKKGERKRDPDEVLHEVTLPAGFWMSVHPVTQSQFEVVMGNNPSSFTRGGADQHRVKGVPAADLARFPVEMVSWEMAQEFCNRLSTRVGQGIRLPTEAEWEYACRAGTATTFHFGIVLDGSQANCDGTHPYGTRVHGPHPGRPSVVGSYPPNAWGLYDMHGNVWQWCLDRYQEDYEKLAAIDPLSPEVGPYRLLRGGSWSYHAYCCRAANRGRNVPTHTYHNAGFRVCFTESVGRDNAAERSQTRSAARRG
jgi:uncharacterized protein (TIGR02996 family)